MPAEDLMTLCDAYDLNTVEAATVILDNYLSDCDGIMEKERKDILIDAMRTLCPGSRFAQRSKEDE